MDLTSGQPDFEVRGIQKSFELHNGGPTNLELALYAMLEEEGITPPRLIIEHPIARPGHWSYVLDAYDTVTKIGYEADGKPWHDKERDRKRDAWIIAHSEVKEIRRYGYGQLKTWIT